MFYMQYTGNSPSCLCLQRIIFGCQNIRGSAVIFVVAACLLLALQVKSLHSWVNFCPTKITCYTVFQNTRSHAICAIIVSAMERYFVQHSVSCYIYYMRSCVSHGKKYGVHMYLHCSNTLNALTHKHTTAAFYTSGTCVHQDITSRGVGRGGASLGANM